MVESAWKYTLNIGILMIYDEVIWGVKRIADSVSLSSRCKCFLSKNTLWSSRYDSITGRRISSMPQTKKPRVKIAHMDHMEKTPPEGEAKTFLNFISSSSSPAWSWPWGTSTTPKQSSGPQRSANCSDCRRWGSAALGKICTSRMFSQPEYVWLKEPARLSNAGHETIAWDNCMAQSSDCPGDPDPNHSDSWPMACCPDVMIQANLILSQSLWVRNTKGRALGEIGHIFLCPCMAPGPP